MTTTAGSVTPADGADVTCTITNTFRPVATATKTVASTVENDNGSWTITYDLVVTNPDSVLAATYSLSDTPDFGTGMTITGAVVTMPDGTAGPAWDGSGTNILATDRPLAAGATETWTIALTATIASSVPPVRHGLQPAGHARLRVLQLGDDHHLVGLGGHLGVLLTDLPDPDQVGGFRTAAPGQRRSGRQLGRHLQDHRHEREQRRPPLSTRWVTRRCSTRP